jgi:ABC-type cobalamin/Fe3+-siderophores transport system ATPase subunit
VALKINHLTSTWGGENSFILSDIDIEVKQGSLVGILGPVGCGKSSIIMSIIQVIDCSFLVDDNDILMILHLFSGPKCFMLCH